MSMSKKDFIALADAINYHNHLIDDGLVGTRFTPDQLTALASFCRDQNSRFMRERWLAYIAGECGPNGGAVKSA